jgi:hypothetical protein
VKKHPAWKSKQPKRSHPILQTDCPYRPATLYGKLFTEGNKDYIPKDELAKRVAGLTGKSVKVVGFAYSVLKSKNHRSNGGRSSELTRDGKVKLVAIRKK